MPPSRLAVSVNDRDHIAGSANAPVTLVEYGDFECPHCGRAEPLVKGIRRYFGDQLRFVYRHFPLSEVHPHAEAAAEASEAAGARGRFWEMHELLFANQHALEPAELVRYATTVGVDGQALARELDARTYRGKVRDDFRGGIRSGVNGTPTFFINGSRYDGDWSDTAAFMQAITDAAALHAGAP